MKYSEIWGLGSIAPSFGIVGLEEKPQYWVWKNKQNLNMQRKRTQGFFPKKKKRRRNIFREVWDWYRDLQVGLSAGMEGIIQEGEQSDEAGRKEGKTCGGSWKTGWGVLASLCGSMVLKWCAMAQQCALNSSFTGTLPGFGSMPHNSFLLLLKTQLSWWGLSEGMLCWMDQVVVN